MLRWFTRINIEHRACVDRPHGGAAWLRLRSFHRNLSAAGLCGLVACRRAFTPSSSSADEQELRAVFPNRRRFHAHAPIGRLVEASRLRPAGWNLTPYAEAAQSVVGFGSLHAAIMVRSRWYQCRDYNSQQHPVPFPQLIRASVGK